ncbi:VOC family protein [Roseivivax sediminis]|uniref:Glyoxalase-like domain-containing protein n=1 Tax=Roseivivax sediminis TaxID=936889 RepID=A0A1I1XKH8_9RHOB|nr:VOC family protein [Roseivivax sediminis]SFE07826.1 Glyoxalase-like domain-containing protein [Roseivivax sediminis]
MLDHLVVAAETLEEAASHAEAALGLPLAPGGKHARYGTHNRVAGLDEDLYVEAIAVDPAAEPPREPRWFGLDRFAGPARLDKWVVRVPDLASALSDLPMAGRPVEMRRGALEWVMAVPEDGELPFDGVFPALIEWRSPVPAGAALDSTGWRVDGLVVMHPEAEALSALLAPRLGAAPVRFAADPVPGLRADLVRQGRRRILQ